MDAISSLILLAILCAVAVIVIILARQAMIKSQQEVDERFALMIHQLTEDLQLQNIERQRASALRPYGDVAELQAKQAAQQKESENHG